MKAAIYYTLVPGWSPQSAYKVMAVTSEKPGRMVYGRDSEGMSTHKTWEQRHGRFETEDAARAVIAQIIAVHDRFADRIAAAKRALREADQEERKAVFAILNEAGAIGS